MVVSETRDVGMDRALEKARTLHTSVGVALHGYQLEPQESAALQQLRLVELCLKACCGVVHIR